MHKFISEATDTNDRMNEKAKTLLVEDYGKDLAGVQALLRRHEALERDMTAIEDKLDVSKLHTIAILHFLYIDFRPRVSETHATTA